MPPGGTPEDEDTSDSPFEGLQPIRLWVLPVKVRSWEWVVCPSSDIRHFSGVTPEMIART